MCVTVEASELMRRMAEPAPAGAHVQTLIRDVARELGMRFSRAKALWYGEARVVRAEEMDAIRAAAARKQGEASSELRDEIWRLRERLVEIEAKLDSAREGDAR